MRMSLETDYAVRIVQCLAQTSLRMGAVEIAEKTRVTERFALKILRKLVASDIVKSFKGKGGGYELNKAPSDITLLDVIEVIEGPIVISRCLAQDYKCDHHEDCTCYFHNVFYEASKQMADKFASVTFSPENK